MGSPSAVAAPGPWTQAGRGSGEPKATAFAESLVWGGAKGWLEVGKGDSVTLIPRLVVELVCCEAEGDRKGHAGGGGVSLTPPSHLVLMV